MSYDKEKQKVNVLLLYPDAEVSKVELQLEIAKDFINERRRYTPTELEPIEDRWLSLQVLMTVEALSKEGAEGEKGHSDNGVGRTYDNASPYSDALINRIIPLGSSFR